MDLRPRVVPADRVPWEHVAAVFSTPSEPQQCWCQWFRICGPGWTEVSPQERAARLREQTGAGRAGAGRSGAPTSGLVAYVDDQPVGWVAVAPRAVHARLVQELEDRTTDEQEHHDPAVGAVWSITCFVVRPGYQGLGVTRALLSGAVAWAREHGAGAVEGYTRVLERTGAHDDEGRHGAIDLFAEAGFVEQARPGLRPVLRLEL